MGAQHVIDVDRPRHVYDLIMREAERSRSLIAETKRLMECADRSFALTASLLGAWQARSQILLVRHPIDHGAFPYLSASRP
jgi:hypothetical protein